MLQNIKELYGNSLAAFDGEIGQVKDFYFDDKTWAVRYLVADTGTWLSGRQVLLSPHAFGRWNRDGRSLLVNLTRKQIENSPSIELHKPVSRQFEEEYYSYYGWPAYWDGGAMWGLGDCPVFLPPTNAQKKAHLQQHAGDDKHLRSTHAITGYHIQTAEGPIGHVRSLMIDDKNWAIRELVVETGHWYSGKEILIPSSKIDRISYEESKIFVRLSKAEIQQTTEDDVVRTRA
jgi:sporulation protein YlmC with PRC-barrel domain